MVIHINRWCHKDAQMSPLGPSPLIANQFLIHISHENLILLPERMWLPLNINLYLCGSILVPSCFTNICSNVCISCNLRTAHTFWPWITQKYALTSHSFLKWGISQYLVTLAPNIEIGSVISMLLITPNNMFPDCRWNCCQLNIFNDKHTHKKAKIGKFSRSKV